MNNFKSLKFNRLSAIVIVLFLTLFVPNAQIFAATPSNISSNNNHKSSTITYHSVVDFFHNTFLKVKQAGLSSNTKTNNQAASASAPVSFVDFTFNKIKSSWKHLVDGTSNVVIKVVTFFDFHSKVSLPKIAKNVSNSNNTEINNINNITTPIETNTDNTQTIIDNTTIITEEPIQEEPTVVVTTTNPIKENPIITTTIPASSQTSQALQGLRGPVGPQGPKGDKGDKGDNATVDTSSFVTKDFFNKQVDRIYDSVSDNSSSSSSTSPLSFTSPLVESSNVVSLSGLTGFGTAGQVIRTNASLDGLEWGSVGGGIDGLGVANELTYWVDSDTLGNLSVSTYPSLTELSYVKGVTSSIQTQLNSKAAALGSDDNYVTDAEKVVIGNTSGTNTGDETLSSIKTKLGVASSGVDGYLSGTDWNTFNGKQAALVSATNIKTVNSTTLLGSGDLAVQATLVSGTNIKTVNGSSLLGSGDLVISGGSIDGSGTANELTYWVDSDTLGTLDVATYPSLTEFSYIKGLTSAIQTQLNAKQATLVSGTNIKTINGSSLVGSGDLVVGGGGGGDMYLANVQTITGAKTFGSAGDVGKLIIAGSTSGTTILDATAVAGSGTVTLPTTGTLSTLAGSEAFTNKTYNGLTVTANGTNTLNIAAGKSLIVSNSLTFSGTDSSTLNIGTGGTLGSNAYTSTAYLPLAGGTMTGNLIFTDNTYDIGASGATRPRTGYFGTSVFSPLLVGGTAVGSGITYKSTTGAGTAAGVAHQFVGGTDGATVAMTLLNNGNVGIGVTNPTFKLQVSGGDASIDTGRKLWFSTYSGVVDRSNSLHLGSAARVRIYADTDGSNPGTEGIEFYGGVADTVTTGPLMYIRNDGNVGIGTTAPTGVLHLKAGTSSAGTAPLKFTAGTNLGTTEAGAIEYDGSHLYFTASNGGTRYQLDQQSAVTNWDTIGDPSGDGSIAFGSTVQTMDWATATTTNPLSLTASALTTGKLLSLTSNTLTSGTLLDLSSNGTGALTGQKGINISMSGANGTASQTTYGGYFSNTHTGTTTSNVGLYATASGATNNYAAIFEAGNVGIGVTNPTNKFEVRSTGGAVSSVIDSVVNVSKYGYAETQYGLYNAAAGTPYKNTFSLISEGTYSDAGTLSNYDFYIFDANASKYRFYIKGDGSVGIGTSSPSEDLSIEDSSSYGSLSIVGAGDGIQFSNFVLNNTADNKLWAFSNRNDGDFLMFSYNGSSYFNNMRLHATNSGVAIGSGTTYTGDSAGAPPANGLIVEGNVGIGTTNPTELLSLGTAGTTKGVLSLAGNTSGKVTIQPAAAAGTWTLTLPTAVGTSGYQLTDAAGNGTTSWAAAGSLRILKNIDNLITDPDQALDTILATPIYNFHYKPGMGTGDSQTQYVGVMADESPWAMHYNGSIVNPVNTLGYMVLGFKATNKKIDDMNLQITNLLSLDSDSGNSIGYLIKTFLASISNGIENIFANRVHTKELCVSDSYGETCITKSQLDALIMGAVNNNTTTTNGGSGGSSSNGDPVCVAPQTLVDGVCTDPSDNSDTEETLTCESPQVLNEAGDACVDPEPAVGEPNGDALDNPAPELTPDPAPEETQP